MSQHHARIDEPVKKAFAGSEVEYEVEVVTGHPVEEILDKMERGVAGYYLMVR